MDQPDTKPIELRTYNHRWDGRLLFLLWRHVNTWTVLAAVILAYLGFYWLTVHRFHEEGLMVRMHAWADALQLREDVKDPGELNTEVENFIEQYQASGFKFYAYRTEPKYHWFDLFKLFNPIGTSTTDEPDVSRPLATVPPDFTNALLVLARSEAPSHEFTEAVATMAKQMKRWGPDIVGKECGLWRFSNDSYHYAGVDFAVPSGDMSGLREEAQLLRRHFDIFQKGDGRLWAGFRNTPINIELAPWTLLRFFDETRYRLNNKLPLAFGTLLLAGAFLLQFRLVDYWVPRDGSHQVEMSYKQPEKTWVAIWERSKTVAAKDSSLFNHPRLAGYMVAGGGAMMFVELFMNLPIQRVEWAVNMPIMVITGLVLPVIWVTLWQMKDLQINPDLAAYTKVFRRRVLRPLVMGVLILVVVSVWGGLYSLLDLPGGTSERCRAVIQLFACGWTLYLLLVLFMSLNRQLRELDLKRMKPSNPKNEEIMNPPESDIVAEFFPGLDERAISAALLALLPVPMIVESFFH